MSPFRSLLTFLLFCVSSISGQVAGQYFGKLDPELQPDMVHLYNRVYEPVTDLSKFHFAIPVEKGSVVRSGPFIDERTQSGLSIMLVIEPPNADPYAWIDGNGNGVYEADERFVFKSSQLHPGQPETIIHLPIKNAYYKDIPLHVRYLADLRNAKAPNARLVEQSVYALAYGHVNIGGRSVLFQYPFEPTKKDISTTEGLFGIDSDGNGSILNQQFSRETSYASATEVVLPLGDLFVSTSSIDITTGKIMVRQRERSEYTRIDLEVGKEMPDFAFVDLSGKPRRLSEFRGKYLMVDFWGAWCGDCTRETPYHLAAYERFKSRGFEILGLDSDQKTENALKYIAENKMTWPQASFDSIKHLAEIDYRIQEYPSTVLLGPDGKVLVLDQHQLQGENLAVTLDKLLPR